MTSECTQIRDLLDSYLGGELLVETNHAVLEHLGRCRACRGELERRQALTARLREAYGAGPETAALRGRIEQALDREQEGWRRGARPAWMPVAAAALLLAAVLALGRVARPVPVDAAALGDSVADHIECALTTPAGATYDPARVARRLPPQFASLAHQFAQRQGGYRLVDAHACPYKNRRYVHFVFRGDGRTVSLFVDEQPHGRLPAPASADDGAFHVSAAATARHQLFVVTDRADAAGDGLARDLLTPSLDFVSRREQEQ